MELVVGSSGASSEIEAMLINISETMN